MYNVPVPAQNLYPVSFTHFTDEKVTCEKLVRKLLICYSWTGDWFDLPSIIEHLCQSQEIFSYFTKLLTKGELSAILVVFLFTVQL